jgi:hypothetical protein
VTDSTLPPAGWYPDPHAPTQQRYWDGQGWTSTTAPGPGASPAPAPHPPANSFAAPQPPVAGSGYGGSGMGPSGPQPTNFGGARPTGTNAAHYERAFAQFDAGGSKVAWNWAAFLLGALWYLYRGMWAKALIYVAVAFFSGGMLAIPVWIYGGLMGTYDYYLLQRRGTQGW